MPPSQQHPWRCDRTRPPEDARPLCEGNRNTTREFHNQELLHWRASCPAHVPPDISRRAIPVCRAIVGGRGGANPSVHNFCREREYDATNTVWSIMERQRLC